MGSEQSLGGKNILVVEDHEESAELLRLILEEELYRVHCVSTASDAIEVLTTNGHSFKPDLILLDLRLPDMDGVEFVETMRQRPLPLPPIVILSADSPESLREAANRLGVTSLRKPFDFEVLFSTIAAELS